MSPAEPEDLAAELANVLDERQGENILALRVRELTSLADYFLIATARNPRHLKALSREIERECEQKGKELLGSEGTPESGWILMDTGEVVAHLFDREHRDLYGLEILWGDAPTVDWKKDNRE